MQRLGISALAVVLLLVAGASPAYANHNQVEATLTVLRDGAELASYSTVVSCSDDACTVPLEVANRDLGRLVRGTGGSNAFQMTFAGSNSSRSLAISGSSHWDFGLDVRLLDDGVETPHGSTTIVTVVVTGGG